mgnify:CR=1 FL=1
MYRIQWARKAQKQLLKLADKDQARIVAIQEVKKRDDRTYR